MVSVQDNRIEDLLQRRSDLSTFLVHFTRNYEGRDARDNLLSMLRGRKIDARNPYGMLKGQLGGNAALTDSQRCVCLTEAPLEHAWMMCSPIRDRCHQFAPYGLAFTKVWARRREANPVWYVDITPGHDWLMNPLNDLFKIAEGGKAQEWPHWFQPQPVTVSVEGSQIAKIAPFIEQMGTHDGENSYRKEFWWEREWRKVGDLSFTWADVVAVFAPEYEQDAMHEELAEPDSSLNDDAESQPPFLDPSWGLERMIAALRGLPAQDIGPMPS
jgi:Putative abortive phage resistance protein AbiGi, antitoxin